MSSKIFIHHWIDCLIFRGWYHWERRVWRNRQKSRSDLQEISYLAAVHKQFFQIYLDFRDFLIPKSLTVDSMSIFFMENMSVLAKYYLFCKLLPLTFLLSWFQEIDTPTKPKQLLKSS